MRPPRIEPLTLFAQSTDEGFVQYLTERNIKCELVARLPCMIFINQIEYDPNNKPSASTVIREYENNHYHGFKVLLWILKGKLIVGQVMMADDEDTVDDPSPWVMQGVIGRANFKIGEFLLTTLKTHLEHDISVRPLVANRPWYDMLKKHSRRSDNTPWIFEPWVKKSSSGHWSSQLTHIDSEGAFL